MTPKAKRRKLHEERLNGQAKPLLDRASWPGWCEIESDPAVFNVMLRELGTSGIKIVDIVSLDEDTLGEISETARALIFLFEYRGNEERQHETGCPEEIWYANQIPDFSCASVALLNIVNNVPSMDLGPHLQSFRDFTAEMGPMDRGYAIDDFHFLKTVHNSFARENDMLHANLNLQQKHLKVQKKTRQKAKVAAQKARLAEKEANTALNGARRPVRTRAIEKLLEDKPEDEDEEDSDPGFHFIAYIPIKGQVWSLDGMDSFPKLIGRVDEGGRWLDVARASVIGRMADYENEAFSFSLMAAVADPYVTAEKELREIQNTKEETTDDTTTNDIAKMTELHDRMLRELELRREDTNKATLQRHDYRDFCTAWVEALKESDVLETLAICAKSEM